MSDIRFDHLVAAQVSLAKAHMEILDATYPKEPDWGSVLEKIDLAEAHLKTVRSGQPQDGSSEAVVPAS